VIAAAGIVSAAVAGPELGTTPGKVLPAPSEPQKGEGVRGVPSNDNCSGAITILASSTTIADNTDATTGATEPGYSCHNGGAGTQGVRPIWYKFVATATTARVQTCNTTAVGDSLIAIYDVDEGNPCNTLTEIGCSDDECGFTDFLSRVDLLSLTVGQTYYIQLSAWTEADVGPYTLQVQSPIPAVSVPCPPGATQEGETDCLTSNPGCAGQGGGPNPLLSTALTLPATICGTSRLDSLSPLTRDNDYYRFSLATESSVTMSINAEFNVQAAILNGQGSLICPNPFAFWEQINTVGGAPGSVTVCLPAGDWLILVRPQGAQATFSCGQGLRYVLNVTNNGACQQCNVSAPSGADFEGEITATGDCGGWISTVDFYNGGCNSVPPVFSPVACGDTIYGTTASTGARRDTDWYTADFTQQTDVTWSGTGEIMELVVGIIDLTGPGTCPASPVFRVAAVSAVCGTATVTATLPAGSYAFFAAPDFTPAVNCPGAENQPNYVVTLTCGGAIVDCNDNGVDDAADIKAGTSNDCFDFAAAPNTAGGPNGVPDECECVADWNRDGISNSTDVSDFINTFFADQTSGGLNGDVNCDGVSNSTDVSDFINIWFAAQAGQLPFAGCTI
jgi:hypothetical protein